MPAATMVGASPRRLAGWRLEMRGSIADVAGEELYSTVGISTPALQGRIGMMRSPFWAHFVAEFGHELATNLDPFRSDGSPLG